MHAKADPKPEAGGGSAGGAKPKTKSEIATDNKAKADAAKTPRIKRSVGTKQDVEDVYSSYLWIDSKDKLQSHMNGTDFSKPIYKTDLPEGITVIQYVRSDNSRVGTHFAPPRTSMDELGINGDRILKSFTTTKPVQVIETTAAEFPLNIVPDVGGSGGRQQYIFGPDFADFLSGG